MHIIIAAEQDLEVFVVQFDNAKTDAEREQIAGNVYSVIGDKIRSMVRSAAKGNRLNDDQINALAWQALWRGLNESGIPKFQRQSAAHSDWQPQIQKSQRVSQTDEPSPLGRIWSMLSPQTQSLIIQNPDYIKSSVQNFFLADLNKILRRRDLYTPRLWHRDSLPFEEQEMVREGAENLSISQLAQLNSYLIASAFSDVELPEQPKRNLLGYIARTVIPQLKPEIWSVSTGREVNRDYVQAWNALKPDVSAVKEMEVTGTLPPEWAGLSFAQRIQQQQLRRLQKTPESKRRPYGIMIIERLLAMEGFQERSAPAAERSAPLTIQRPAEEMEVAADRRAYRYLIDKLFGKLGLEAEHAVGVYLSGMPRPTDQQIQKFLHTLPQDLAEDIRSVGFRSLAREIDERILAEIDEPETRSELQRLVGFASSQAMRGIRREVFIRTSKLIIIRSECFSKQAV